MLISIVIPIYNNAEYIVRCLQSLIVQDLNDVEVLCIDDGSTDDSIQRLNSFLDNLDSKPHIKLLKNDVNKGVSYTRNRGINESNGEYVIFVDSDDYVSPDYISTLKRVIYEEGPDVIIFDFLEYKKNGEVIQHVTECSECKESVIIGLFLNKLHNHLANKLFKRSLYLDNNITFPFDLKLFEDKAVCFRLIYYSKCIKIINRFLYFYDRTNENSLTSKKYKSLIPSSVKAIAIIDSFFEGKVMSDDLTDAILSNKMFVAGFIYLFGNRQDQVDNASFLVRFPNRIIFKKGNFPFYYRLAVFFSQNHLSCLTKALTILYNTTKMLKSFK